MKEEKILILIQRKKGFFEAILDLTQTEQELSLRQWIGVLEQKKILLSCVDEIDQELMPYKESLLHLSQDICDELEELRKVIERILHLDALNQEKRKKELKP